MGIPDIQDHMQEVYGLDVSPQLVSDVTAAVCKEATAWQSRALEPVYLVVYLDTLVVKIQDKGVVPNMSIYLVVGLLPDGSKDVLGMWIAATEGAKFWLSILSELRQRGVRERMVLCADGLKGADLRSIYSAANAKDALLALDAFEALWGSRFPMIGKAWRARWNEISPFLEFPQKICRVIYTTNATLAINRQLRKVLKTKGVLPDDDAAFKLLFLVLRNAKKSWGSGTRDWTIAGAQIAIFFGDRFPQSSFI